MATQKKATSPDYYWIDYVRELQALVDPSDPLFQQYDDLMRMTVDYSCLYLVDWCQVALPAQEQPTTADFVDGTWVDKFVSAAQTSVFYNNCEEV
jgi:hypothetical protein